MNLPSQMLEVLRLAVRARKADRFSLIEIAGTKATGLLEGLDELVEWGFVERVTVACGRWFYRLTPKGIDAECAGKIPNCRQAWVGHESDTEPVSSPNTASGRGRRVNHVRDKG